MPYRIVSQPRAWWPVEWPGVAEDGAIVTNRIDLRFHLLKVDAGADFVRDVEEARRRETEDGVDLPLLYAGLVQRIAGDWRGIEAENGEPLRWDGASLAAIAAAAKLDADDTSAAAEATRAAAAPGPNLRALLNEPGLFARVFESFRAALNARPKLREGN